MLDFANVSGDREMAWRSSGIAETVTNDLRALSTHRVIDRVRVVEAVRRAGPDLSTLRAELHLDRAVVSRPVDCKPKTTEIDDAVPHHSAAGNRAGRRDEPIGDVETDDQATGAINFHLDVRVPEHVVGIDDHTDPTVEHTGEVDRLAQRDDH